MQAVCVAGWRVTLQLGGPVLYGLGFDIDHEDIGQKKIGDACRPYSDLNKVYQHVCLFLGKRMDETGSCEDKTFLFSVNFLRKCEKIFCCNAYKHFLNIVLGDFGHNIVEILA